MPEKEAARIWRRQMLHAERLTAESGEPLDVIYSGKPNDDAGPDFQGAVIAIGGSVLRGDVEIHTRSADWYAHHHHQDSAYNGVILHAVMQAERSAITLLQNGAAAPILNMSKYLAEDKESGLSAHCRFGGGEEGDILDELGSQRFLKKAAAFRKESAVCGAAQALYAGLMGALGYSRNKIPFQELARRLPLSTLEALGAEQVSDAEYVARLQNLLFSAAGLPAGGTGGVSSETHSSVEPLPQQAWRLVKVRPGNSPAVRLAAMSHILLRCRREGLVEWALEMVRHAPLSRECGKVLEGWVAVGTSVSQHDFKQTALLGSERAADIAVNILLPFSYAFGEFQSIPELAEKAAGMYRLYPRLAVNSAERFMLARLKLNVQVVNSARRQQGLLHIYKNFCAPGRCWECALTPASTQV